MKKLLFSIAIVAVATTMDSCGNQTTRAAQEDSDSTVVNEVPDTLNSVEDVVKQVDAVYAYWNELRANFDENKPYVTVDERFGTKEWWQVRQEVAAIDRECECGGFFDFGDEGPLDPWTYDCYEGVIRADSIQAKLLPDGTAEVNFLVKDAVTIKGIPTGIKTIKASDAKTDGVCYNLSGQRVGADYKGIVIHNGKKMQRK